jgi:ferric-dicitrate binding protein FerR (iron transport regulator)
MNHPVDKLLIIRYFGGLCTPAETVWVEEWLQQAEHETLMQQWLWEDWQETLGNMPEETATRLKEKLAAQTGRRSPVVRMRRSVFYRVAAAVVLAVVVAGGLLLSHQRTAMMAGRQEIVYRDSILNKDRMPFKATLADGSTVWLNTDAVVYIAADFGKTTRRVKVKGEAFFDIQPNASQPFYTEAGGITTQVLGTAYTIEAYPSEQEIHVSLLSGSVAVHSADTTCLLRPGEMVSYTRQSGTMQAGVVATADPSAWIKGKIVLNKIALPEALDRLSRLYHTSIQYDRERVKDKYITGEFDRDSLPEVLQSMLFVHNLQYQPLTNGGYQVH